MTTTKFLVLVLLVSRILIFLFTYTTLLHVPSITKNLVLVNLPLIIMSILSSFLIFVLLNLRPPVKSFFGALLELMVYIHFLILRFKVVLIYHVFLNYSKFHKGYLFKSGRICISKDVIFNEIKFLYADMFTQSSSAPEPISKQYFDLNPNFFFSPAQSLITPPQSTHSVSTVVSIESESLPGPINTHSMQTRSKSGIIRQRIHPSLLLTNIEPCNASQALKNVNWAIAMTQELTNSSSTPIPSSCTPI